MISIPNYLSKARIILSFALLLFEPLGAGFLIIYFVCGMTDILDGWIARKTNTMSKFGAKLDSAADLIMVTALIVILFPVINIPAGVLVCAAVIIAIRITSIIIVLIKFKIFGILHTWGNKVTGLMLFLYPFVLVFTQSEILMYLICATGFLSAVEELVIHMISNDFTANRKSILVKDS